MAFLFDLRRVQPSGLAAELVVSIAVETSLTETTLKKQFARTPYAVSFESQGTTFTLVTLHVLWGDNAAQRLPEITEIAKRLADWARGGDEFGDNLMTLGDFNIDRANDPLYQAFVANLTPPLRYEDLGGNFDFRPALQGTLSISQLSWRISDHFPLWASFSVRPT